MSRIAKIGDRYARKRGFWGAHSPANVHHHPRDDHLWWGRSSSRIDGTKAETYWAAEAHLGEQQGLLEGRQAAQVDGGKATDGHRGDAVEEAVDVVDWEFAIYSV